MKICTNSPKLCTNSPKRFLKNIVTRFFNNFSRKGFCRNPRGFFPNKVLGEFCRGFFWWILSGLFPWKKRSKKNPPKNPQQNLNRNLGVSRPKSTLQGSCLDNFRIYGTPPSPGVYNDTTEKPISMAAEATTKNGFSVSTSARGPWIATTPFRPHLFHFTWSAKTDPVQFKWGFREGRLKDKFALFESYKNPRPKRRKLLIKHPFL